jgi:hypothetical protein
LLLDVPSDRAGVEGLRDAQGPPERPSTERGLEAVQVRMQVRTPARQPPPRIGGEHAPNRHDAEQVSHVSTDPASHTGALWACASPEFRGHRPV